MFLPTNISGLIFLTWRSEELQPGDGAAELLIRSTPWAHSKDKRRSKGDLLPLLVLQDWKASVRGFSRLTVGDFDDNVRNDLAGIDKIGKLYYRLGNRTTTVFAAGRGQNAPPPHSPKMRPSNAESINGLLRGAQPLQSPESPLPNLLSP